jgi:hypothetical protein
MKKGLLGATCFESAHRLRLSHEVGREVVALLRGLIRLGLAVVAHELRVILMRVAAQKAVEALESAAKRPAVVGAGGRGLLGGRQMPLAQRVGVVTVLEENF